MIVYQKDGKDFILMANSSRGVMKLPAAKLDGYSAITAQTEKQGVRARRSRSSRVFSSWISSTNATR